MDPGGEDRRALREDIVIPCASRMTRLLSLLIVCASLPAAAGTVARPGATLGLQRTDRSAWVFGPSLEVTITDAISIRGEGQIELGDFDDPFGDTNLRTGDGPHVNHALFGPTWRPMRYAEFVLDVGAQAGVMIMHSRFSHEHFTTEPSAGVFVQAGRMLGPVSIALQLRLDLSATVPDAGPNGEDVPTTCGRINLAIEFPIKLR
jgi:hypothetical protein